MDKSSIRYAIVGIHALAIGLTIANFSDMPMYKVYLVSQAITYVSLVLVFYLNLQIRGRSTFRQFKVKDMTMAIFLVLFLISMLVRIGFLLVYESQGKSYKNMSYPMIRWDAFSAGTLFMIFLHTAYFTIAPKGMPFRRLLYVLALFFVVPIYSFIPYMMSRRSLDKRIANTCINIIDWVMNRREDDGKKVNNDLTIVGYEFNKTHDVSVVLCTDEKDLYISFSATRSNQNWKQNITFLNKKLPVAWFGDLKNARACGVHKGFFDAYNVFDEMLLTFVRMHHGNFNRIIVTGYSLGGAIATFCALRVATVMKDLNKLYVYTFASPQVGDELFVECFDSNIRHSVRVVNPYDGVTEAFRFQLVHVKGYYVIGVGGKGVLPLYSHDLNVYMEGINQGHVVTIINIILPVVIVLLLMGFFHLKNS